MEPTALPLKSMKQPMPWRVLLLWVVLWGLLAGLIGFGVDRYMRQKDPNWVAAGHFRLWLDGAVTATLEGEASYVLAPDGTIALLELEAASHDSAGVSMELNGVRPTSASWVMYSPAIFSDAIQSAGTAFLTIDELTFAIEEGELRIDTVEDEEVAATFEAIMRGYHQKMESEELVIHVTGILRAERHSLP